jgi:hypothetical protein
MDNMNDMLGGLSPEEIQALLATIGDPAQLDALKSQGEMADALRNQHSSPGAMAGNTYVANVPGAISDIGAAFAGKRLSEKTDAARKELFANQAAQSDKFIKAMMARQGMAAPTGGGALRGY